MRILLVDDHSLVRAGLRRVLESFSGVEVVAEAEDGDQVEALVVTHHPDIVVTDLSMRRKNGDELIRALKARHPEMPVIVVSMHADAQHVRGALEAGASGYVVKDAAPSELQIALSAAAAGQTFLSPRVAGEQLSGSAGPQLSPRQGEILRLLGQGLVTKEIAARLGLSVKTVETHRARLMQALRLRRASELVRYAVLHTGTPTS